MDLDATGTQDLARRAKEGDREALDALVRRTYPGLARDARLRLRTGPPALRARLATDDLAQSAIRDALRVLPAYRPQGEGSFRAWLAGFLRNKVHRRLAFFRARRRDARLEAPLEAAAPVHSREPLPPDVVIREEERRRLEEAVNSLPERDRTIIVCRYHLDLPWKEVGERVGIGEEAAQMACRRALGKLRGLFDPGP